MWYERVDETSQLESEQMLAGLTLVRKIPIASEEPYGYFIVQLNEHVFADIFDQMRLGNTGGMLLLTPSGNRYAEPSLEQLLLKQREHAAVIEALTTTSESLAERATVLRTNSGKLLVHLMESPANGWKYAAIVPYDEITAPLQTIFKVLWTTCALIIGIIMVVLLRLYYRAAGRLKLLLGRMKYKFRIAEEKKLTEDEIVQIEIYMDHMHGMHEVLENKLLSSLPDLKAHYVRKWLTEAFSASLQENLKKYGLYDPDHLYAPFCMEWDAIPFDFTASVSLKIEDMVLTLGRIEVSPVRCYLVRLDDDRVGGVLEVDQKLASDEFKSCVATCLHAYVMAAARELKQSIVIGASGEAIEAADISENFRQATEALRHRLVNSNKSILFIDEADRYPEAFRYPVQQEQSIVAAIHLDDLNQAYAALDGFAETLSRENKLSSEQLVHAYSLLVSTLLRTGSGAGNGFTVEQRLFRIDVFERLARLRTIDQIHQWLKEEVLERIAEKSRMQRVAAGGQDAEMIKQAITYIHDHSDQDISLKKVAEWAGLRESQFSVLFKQEAGLTYTEYVTAYRVERAKALLVQTDLKIAEIAQRMSYGNSQNFIRLFKQKIGVTPGEYRKSNRKRE